MNKNFFEFSNAINDFEIFELSDINSLNDSTFTPLPLSHYAIILVVNGSGNCVIDFHEYKLENSQAYFLIPNQICYFVVNDNFKAFIINFNARFLNNNNIPLGYIEDLNLFHDYGHSPPMPLHDFQLEVLTNYSAEMLKFQSSEIKFKDELIASYLKLFLIQCNNHCSIPKINPLKLDAKNLILKKFKDLVEINFGKWNTLNLYAEALNISPDHLNRSVKQLIGQTAKGYLQNRITTEAKRLLYFSNDSSKEIAFKLGFDEPANFSAFFKKNTGFSPSEFRKKS